MWDENHILIRVRQLSVFKHNQNINFKQAQYNLGSEFCRFLICTKEQLLLLYKNTRLRFSKYLQAW